VQVARDVLQSNGLQLGGALQRLSEDCESRLYGHTSRILGHRLASHQIEQRPAGQFV
jgi:hypothetical protein